MYDIDVDAIWLCYCGNYLLFPQMWKW